MKTTIDNTEMEAAVVRALEARPKGIVPADFAARIRASLPAQAQVRSRARVGRLAGLVAAVLLMVVLFLVAPHAAPSFSSMAFDVELLVLVQLAGIAYWLAARREV